MYLYVFQSARVSTGAHTASNEVVIGDHYPQVKRPGLQTDHSPYLMPRIMMDRATIKCLNDPQRDNFLFALYLQVWLASDLDGGDGSSSRPDLFTPVFTK
jgi:hypothetical protein